MSKSSCFAVSYDRSYRHYDNWGLKVWPLRVSCLYWKTPRQICLSFSPSIAVLLSINMTKHDTNPLSIFPVKKDTKNIETPLIFNNFKAVLGQRVAPKHRSDQKSRHFNPCSLNSMPIIAKKMTFAEIPSQGQYWHFWTGHQKDTKNTENFPNFQQLQGCAEPTFCI